MSDDKEMKGAELLVDGSFETAKVGTNTWSHQATVGGWRSDSEIETWGKGFYGLKAADGNKFAELDYDTRQSNIYQTVDTEAGAEYTFSFDYMKRPDSKGGSDTIEVFWNNKLVGTVDPTKAEWSKAEFKVIGTGGDDKIEFREAAGDNDSYGGLLDNASMKKSGPSTAEKTASEKANNDDDKHDGRGHGDGDHNDDGHDDNGHDGHDDNHDHEHGDREHGDDDDDNDDHHDHDNDHDALEKAAAEKAAAEKAAAEQAAAEKAAAEQAAAEKAAAEQAAAEKAAAEQAAAEKAAAEQAAAEKAAAEQAAAEKAAAEQAAAEKAAAEQAAAEKAAAEQAAAEKAAAEQAAAEKAAAEQAAAEKAAAEQAAAEKAAAEQAAAEKAAAEQAAAEKAAADAAHHAEDSLALKAADVAKGYTSDEMHGNAGDDALNGGVGDDKLFGHDGNDKLSGDTGGRVTSPLEIAVDLVDADNSETLSLVLSGMPKGATLSAGTDNGDGTWSLTAGELKGLSITADDRANFQLHVVATAVELMGWRVDRKRRHQCRARYWQPGSPGWRQGQRRPDRRRG